MKNAIKKMKWGILALGLVLGMGLALSLRADIKYFWLDHPTGRNNPNDPLSPLYKSPTPQAGNIPGIKSSSPDSGPASGGYPLILTADNVESGAAIVFNGTVLTTAITDLGGGVSQLVATAPSASGATATITVNNPPAGSSQVTQGNLADSISSAGGGSGGTITLVVGTATATQTQTETTTETATETETPNLTETFIAGQGTATDTPTDTPTATPTDTPSATPTYTLSPNFTATNTPTITPTSTISPTFSPTPQAGWPCLYGTYSGGNVMLSSNEFIAGGTGGFSEVNPGAGPGGGTYFVDVTLSASAYSSGADFSTGFSAPSVPILEDATAYNALSITVSVPPCNCPSGTNEIVPGVSLVFNNGSGGTNQTAVLNLENFLVGGAQYIPPNASTSAVVWYTAVIPISVFDTLYSSDLNATPTAADLQGLEGVEVQPANYGNSGAINSEIYVGSIVFNSATNALAPTGLTGNDFTGLFSDFEDGTTDDWGAFWSTNADAFTATDCPGYSAPPGSPNLTSVTYGGVTDTAGAQGENSGTPCHDAHFAGVVGSFNGPFGSPACTNANAFPYLNMTAWVDVAQVAENLSNNSYISTFPSTGATGMSVELQPGPTNSASQVYGIGLVTSTDSGGNIWFFQVSNASLTAGTWTQFVIPFPADGSVNPLGVGGTNGTLGQADFTHGDQGSGGNELWFGQTQYATYGAFSRNNIQQVEIEAIVRGVAADLYIDDVQFYSGSGPVAAKRAPARLVRVRSTK